VDRQQIPTFVTSSYSDRECVGVARADGVQVGDSKTGYASRITVSDVAWQVFLQGVVRDDVG
jgi:hypothetical protein